MSVFKKILNKFRQTEIKNTTPIQEVVKKQVYIKCIDTDSVCLEIGEVYLVVNVIVSLKLEKEFYEIECAEKGLLSGIWDPDRFIIVSEEKDKREYHLKKFKQSFKNI